MKGLRHALQRLSWVRRRLRRMAPGEGLHRLRSGLRVILQSLGLGDARRVPRPLADACDGRAWIQVPAPVPGDAAASADTWQTGQEAILLEAERLLHEGPVVFGLPTPAQPRWNHDPSTGRGVGLRFGLFIDFRSLPGEVDVKFLWEVNRHVWWLPLAQAWALTADTRYLSRLRSLLASWLDDCPYPLGPNWSSPVEHGIRLIVWSLVWQLVGGFDGKLFEGPDGERLRSRWLDSIHQHMRFALDNESLHSSANNHLIGEAAGLFVASHTWDRWDASRRMRAHAKQVLEREILRQFAADGVNLEQATCYHKFALQFVLAAALCGRANGDGLSAQAMARVGQAARAMAAQMDTLGNLPSIGDADDGEVFRLDWREDFDHYRSLLALAARLGGDAPAWAKAVAVGAADDIQCLWLQPGEAPASGGAGWPASALQQLPVHLPQGGVLLLGDRLHARDEWRVQFDIGPLGFNRIAGHGHADALSVLMSVAGQPLLVDAGTYCYNTEAAWRRHFRGTSAHNTLCVDARDQADYGGPFLWLGDVNSVLEAWQDDGESAMAKASHDGYLRLADPVRHHRRLILDRRTRCLFVDDWIDSRFAHHVAWHWQLPVGAHVCTERDDAWRISAGRWVLQVQVRRDELQAAVTRVASGQTHPLAGWISTKFQERCAAPSLELSGWLAPGRTVRTEFRLAEA